MAKMTFKRDWDFNHGNRPVFLNDMTQDEQVRQILQDAIGIAGRGEDGEDGRGIVSVTRTSGTGAPGTTDTYTITYTDATTSTFTIYNGRDGIDGEGTQSANEVPYVNTTSGMAATDVQAAVDELAARPQVLLLEAGEDESDVPPETPVGTVVFRKAGA